jgi:hypothetical protein
MVLQGFETPRKVNDLGAAVAAGALLLGQGLVGMLTTKPARIALQPIDGSGGAIIDIPAIEARDFALLSKDTAVVLGGGGALFALQDLQSAVKPRPIAREVRALSSRPFGESAFAIGDEGKAMALTLSRNEVGVRTFSMRGALYACDIGEHVTYAIVDDERGRQLRVHSGATPEVGTSVRVTLPEGAAGLDRVRGSQNLSAVFKRGDERVCVVQGSAKPQAKMIRLDAKPADVAVLDGCLLVAFLDGRLALYDRDAIEGAGDSPLSATAVTPLGAQGRPRVIVAASGKASASLWVGTTAGEVFRAGLTMTAEAVSQPRAQPPPPARNEAPQAPDRAEELLARERELEELRTEMAQLKASQAAELDALRAEKNEALEELRANHRKALEEHDAAHRKALEEHDAAHRKALEEHETAHRKAIEEHDAAHSKALQDIRKQLEAQTKVTEQMRSEIEQLVAARAEERERIEKLFPFGSEGIRSFERARDKLDSLITRIKRRV